MADEKLNTDSGEEKLPEAPAPVTADGPQAPAPEQTAAPTPQQEGPAQPEPGDVVVSFDKINELMNEKRQTARAEVEKEEAAKEPEEKTQEEPPAAGDDKPKKARRGRPPKEEKAEPADKEAAKPRKGRPPKADKAAPGEATPTKRDKLVCTPSSRQRNNLHFTHENPSCIPYGAGCYAASRRSWTSIGVRTPRPRWRRRKL